MKFISVAGIRLHAALSCALTSKIMFMREGVKAGLIEKETRA